ncbi:MAG: DEAD/DEAH box helicase [Candidatus Margulisbacteria bacterium]|jgi:SNF2 family DNA or RNA helicase|nr:DEAD/DEAH box helicase [Candidatus Margulisiibacteriota bacterium]
MYHKYLATPSQLDRENVVNENVLSDRKAIQRLEILEFCLNELKAKPFVDISIRSITLKLNINPQTVGTTVGLSTKEAQNANKIKNTIHTKLLEYISTNKIGLTEIQKRNLNSIEKMDYKPLIFNFCLNELKAKPFVDISIRPITLKLNITSKTVSTAVGLSRKEATDNIKNVIYQLLLEYIKTNKIELTATQKKNINSIEKADYKLLIFNFCLDELKTKPFADISIRPIAQKLGIVTHTVGTVVGLSAKEAMNDVRKIKNAIHQQLLEYIKTNKIKLTETQKKNLNSTEKIDYKPLIFNFCLDELKTKPLVNITIQSIANKLGITSTTVGTAAGLFWKEAKDSTNKVKNVIHQLLLEHIKINKIKLTETQKKNLASIKKINYKPLIFSFCLNELKTKPFADIYIKHIAKELGISPTTVGTAVELLMEEARDTNKIKNAIHTQLLEHIKTNKIKLPETQLSHLLSYNPEAETQLENFNSHRLQIELLDFRQSTDIDWLEFTVHCTVNGQELTSAEIQKIIDAKSEYIYLEDGSYIKVPEVERFYLQKYLQNRVPGTNLSRAPRRELHKFLETNEFMTAQIAENWRILLEQMQSQEAIPSAALPRRLGQGITLRPYQHKGYDWLQWLHKNNFNGILADEMGLGKTAQVLTHLAGLKESGELSAPALIVAPKSVAVDAWSEANIRKFAPELKVLAIYGRASERLEAIGQIQDYDLIITTYDNLARDIDNYTNIKFSYAVLDEAQNIKNAATGKARTAHKLQAVHRLAITGTPLETNLGDLWSIFNWLMPGFLSQQYLKDILDLKDKPLEYQAALHELSEYMQPYILRRLKKDQLQDLPPKTEITERFNLTPAQWQAYKQVITDYNQKKDTLNKIEVLGVLHKLLQICNHSATLKQGEYLNIQNDTVIVESAKFLRFKELLANIIANGEKVIVFSQSVRMLEIMKHYLAEQNINSVRISGNVNNDDRQTAIQNFQNDPVTQVFLGSLKASGTGITLTAGSYVIMYDQWWNPATMDQAIDRAHRIGQLKKVTVYNLITRSTIEEKILNLQLERRELAEKILPGDKTDGKQITAASAELHIKKLQEMLNIEAAELSGSSLE